MKGLGILVLLVLAVLAGGWAVMMTVALLGGSVSFGKAMVVFLLFRLFIAPPVNIDRRK